MRHIYTDKRNFLKFNIKITYFFTFIVVFSVMYSFLNSSHFHGINPVQDKIKDNLVKTEIENGTESFSTDKDTQKLTENVRQVVKNDEQKIKRPSISQKYFDSLYFSINNACLLGYGDIYPATNILKGIVSLQALITICLILY
jgi:hypothetical protein|tara:strand:- start:1636 stop:2064 length:429 start_codon:yes stop_codon:yes gene_type:complete